MALGKIEHLGIAVKDLQASEHLFQDLLGLPPYKREKVDSEGVETSFFMAGNNKIELLSASSPDSPIQKFLDKNGEGIHHVAFHVEDLFQEIERLSAAGFTVLNNPQNKEPTANSSLFCTPKEPGAS